MTKCHYPLLITLCLSLLACEPEPKSIPDDVYKVVKPIEQNVDYANEYVADIQSVRFVEIRSKVKGYIEAIHVDEGQAVKQGQPLFTLNVQEFEKKLKKAKAAFQSSIADLKAAQVELKNVKLLAEKDIISQAELDVARAKVESLRADTEEAKADQELAALNIEFSNIKAPFAGTINRIPKKVGSLIDEGEMLTSISDHQNVFAYFNLTEIDYLNRINAGKRESDVVELKLADNSLYPYPGKIETIESEFDHATGNIAFRARFPNPDDLLKHGSNAKVVIRKHIENALVIPQKSTFEIQDKLYVYVVDSNNRLKQRNVIPKMRFPHYFVVDSGLTKNDVIVYEGVESLKDGATIQPEPADLAQLMSSEQP